MDGAKREPPPPRPDEDQVDGWALDKVKVKTRKKRK